MDSRQVLKNQHRLGVLVDSQSIDAHLSTGDSDAHNLLAYATSPSFQFLRTPWDTTHEALARIPAFRKVHNATGEVAAIEFEREESHVETAIGYEREFLWLTASLVFGVDRVGPDKLERTTQVLILDSLRHWGHVDLMVTQDEVMLENRLRFEAHIPEGRKLNIVTVAEAKEIMDLFSKHEERYHLASNFTCNKWYWYWLSFRSRIPHFHVVDATSNALANRVVYLLMSVDEMGTRYYSGAGGDSSNDLIYHFNYFLALATGILDSLATWTRVRLSLAFKGNHIPGRTSLNSRAGYDFLKALARSSPDLGRHVDGNREFIALLFALREAVVHREMMQRMLFEHESQDEHWMMTFLAIDPSLASLVTRCGDSPVPYDPVSRWGVYQLHTDSYLEPFRFAKSAARRLLGFTDLYLQSLGFSDFIEELAAKNPRDRLAQDIRTLRSTALDC